MQGTTLADASRWPDNTGCQISDMDPYHFNFPKDANTYEQQRDSKCATALSRRLAGICRCSSGRMRHGTRRTALRFIAHLVSDIHHPLHAGFPEDRGGADLHVSLNVRKMNLQSI
jgi:nuclease S1